MPAEPLAARLAGVTHRYGATLALDAVDLDVPAGLATAVIGPDGVGKSTLLALVAGAKRIQQGTVEALGGSMALPRHRDTVSPRIAYMPQGLGASLYATLSVRENIAFFARLFGVPAQGERIDRLLRATGLSPFPDRPAGKLSGGMKQKLALCCALVHEPDLLVLDEPTTGVDPLSRRQFWRLVDEFRAERPGMTVLVSTAYMEEAARFDRVVALDEGKALAQGTLPELLARAGAATLEAAYRSLQRPERRGPDAAFTVEPRVPREGPPAIDATGLTKRFGDFVAVDQVSFRIERGEIFGFLGSNGCGKTTTMKMLTGLLPASEGEAHLLGAPVGDGDIEVRRRVGYMSQSFSLYEELTVRANLALHGRLYGLPGREADAATSQALERFDLSRVADALPASLPLGMRQRLQLAAACLHRPEVLILDEPTSGVDPGARDLFWRLLLDLSRREGVTIFVSTHFMNEAARCDRISLMDAGRVLAVGAPAELAAERGGGDLEEAFVAWLEEAAASRGEAAGPAASDAPRARPAEAPPPTPMAASGARIAAFARREALELWRDPIRLAFAVLSPLLLLVTFGYGISFDVERLPFAALDRDRSAESREFIAAFSSSRYFDERRPLVSEFDIDQRLKAGEIRLAIDIAPNFGRDLMQGRAPQMSLWLDGSNTFRAETARGYAQGVVISALQDLARRSTGRGLEVLPLSIEPRFRYNQAFRSVFAITPGIIMLLLMLIPAMLTAVGVVREKEMGSIVNLAVSPATVGEFLLGKQAPYVAIGFVTFITLSLLAGLVFGVWPRGSLLALACGALLYVAAATAFGLLVSTFVRTQVAAIFATAILTILPAVNFSGLLYPTGGLEGVSRWMGLLFPASWFQSISIGVFAKGLPLNAFLVDFAALGAFAMAFMAAARLLLRKQEA
ncbi:ribosome-associated ATPase/putative transporter RbbA [Alsobacter sp. SYSU M60028]|uniref:Ribosome-associated ATPase/putative transporter RbbA n=1 Tax=Alsobacter ponti TaxID=2962936 RepID=A0ABT1L983_9HYPH|nr:ribosome-associated ATPase/putative transporter RbbA [Alsobacter ponti]MCP8938004.1 ribosome-associated ATPase/putative transporter RbbA [Alsobacter ponti]